MEIRSRSHFLIAGFIVASFLSSLIHAQKPYSKDIQSRIERVENGLLPLLLNKGEKGWNILERMKHYQVPGVGIAVINDGEIEWTKGYGVMETGTAKIVTTETLFQTGSIGKTIAALATLSLVNKGLLNLDVDVNRYLKSWKVRENEFTPVEKVTIRRILSHTAGLNEDNSPEFQDAAALPTMRELLNANNIEVIKKPGEGYLYSGAGYIVLELLIEDVTGKPYKQIVAEEVLRPLGMADTYLQIALPDNLLQKAAFAHKKDGSVYKTKYPFFPCFAPGTCNWSTPGDLAKLFLEIQKSFYGKSNKILPQSLAKIMATNASPTYGLGIKLIPDNGSTLIGHSGDFYGFHAAIYGYLQNGKGVVIMTNGDNGVLLYNEIIRSVSVNYHWPGCRPEIASQERMDPAQAEKLCGCYYVPSKMDVMNIYLQNGSLMCDLLGHSGSELVRIGEDKYYDPANDGIIKFSKEARNKNYGTEFQRIGVLLKGELLDGFDLLGTARFEEEIKVILGNKNEYVNQKYANIFNTIGYALLEKKMNENAIAVFKLSVVLFPDSWNAFDSLAEAYMKNGDIRPAIENYEQSLKLNPRNDNAKEMLKQLKQ